MNHFVVVSSSYGFRFVTYALVPEARKVFFIHDACNVYKETIVNKLSEDLNRLGAIKFQLSFKVSFVKNERECIRDVKSNYIELLRSDIVEEKVILALERIMIRISEYPLDGGMWCYDRVLKIELRVGQFCLT